MNFLKTPSFDFHTISFRYVTDSLAIKTTYNDWWAKNLTENKSIIWMDVMSIAQKFDKKYRIPNMFLQPIVLYFRSVSLPPPHHFELGVQNRLNQLCSNCADISFNCTRSFFQLPRGWFSELRPPSRISDWKQRESIVLQLCSTVLEFFSLVPAPFFMTQSLEVEFCEIELTFLLKIAASSLEIRRWFLQRIVQVPKFAN